MTEAILMKNLLKKFLCCLLLLVVILFSACAEYTPKGAAPAQEALRVYFIDVGQADCALITEGAHAMLIDGGNAADAPEIIDYLQSLKISHLDIVVATHAHEDHIGGLSKIIDTFSTGTVYTPVKEYDSACFRAFLSSAGEKLTTAQKGMTWQLGKAEISVLWPQTPIDTENTNNTSIVLRLVYGSISFLFTGDLEADAESKLAQSEAALSSTVLKVGHHGSATSSSYTFLRRVLPQFAVISCGAGNSYGHPEEATLSRLAQAEAQIYRTDQCGTILVQTDGETLTFRFGDTVFTASPAPPATPALENDGAYIGNLKSKKFHLPSCSALPAEDNRVYFAARETALAQGYTPCSNCKP